MLNRCLLVVMVNRTIVIRNYTVLQKYAHIGLKQNVLISITPDVITRLPDKVAFACIHVVGRFLKDFSEVRRGFS